jgi:hypothetical protein
VAEVSEEEAFTPNSKGAIKSRRKNSPRKRNRP